MFRLGAKRKSRNELWLERHLPSGYRAVRLPGGRFTLLKDGATIRMGVTSRWEVRTMARHHAKGRKLPYRFSWEYWRDIEQGKSGRWARVCYWIWKLRWLT